MSLKASEMAYSCAELWRAWRNGEGINAAATFNAFEVADVLAAEVLRLSDEVADLKRWCAKTGRDFADNWTGS